MQPSNHLVLASFADHLLSVNTLALLVREPDDLSELLHSITPFRVCLIYQTDSVNEEQHHPGMALLANVSHCEWSCRYSQCPADNSSVDTGQAKLQTDSTEDCMLLCWKTSHSLNDQNSVEKKRCVTEVVSGECAAQCSSWTYRRPLARHRSR
jgi:hypothetical protein